MLNFQHNPDESPVTSEITRAGNTPRYRKNTQITWYAFYEELENVYSIVYLANNRRKTPTCCCFLQK